ncbi:hypothetical protein pdam_00011029, partial [Pocillopora damicornis]
GELCSCPNLRCSELHLTQSLHRRHLGCHVTFFVCCDLLENDSVGDYRGEVMTTLHEFSLRLSHEIWQISVEESWGFLASLAGGFS